MTTTISGSRITQPIMFLLLTAAITSSAQNLVADQGAAACPQCGAQIVTGAKFCNQYGNSLAD